MEKKSKRLEIGKLMVKDGTFLTLGRQNGPGYEKYNLSVEVTVRDNEGKVVAQQTDGFISLVDPRTEPDRLLSLGIIDEARALEMKERAARLPSSIKYVLQLKS